MSAHATVDQVVVTGGRWSTAPGEQAAREEAARVPGGASIVALDEYDDGRASNLLDVFMLTPGVLLQPRFGADEARLSIRGSGLQRTFHLRGVNLLQDGVPLTLADGGSDFQAIEPLALAYVEVMRGANALRYGGGTLGGSINFVSPTGRDMPGWRARVEAGSFGYQRAVLSTGGGGARSDYFMTASGSRQQGFRDWSEQKNLRFSGNLGWPLHERAETRMYVAALQSSSHLPGALTLTQLMADPRQAAAGSLGGRQARDYDLYRLANRTVLDLGGDVLELTAGYTNKDLWHPIFQVLQQRSGDWSTGLRYVGDYTAGGRTGRVVAGAMTAWNTVRDRRFTNVAGVPGAPTAHSRQRSRNLTLYIENQLDLDTVTLVTGGQWTTSKRRYDDWFPDNGDQGLDATYQRLSPRLGFLWRPREAWTVFGNVSDSFEPPSFGELSGGPGVTLLQAQRARTLELGSRGHAGPVRWDVAAYAARVRNELLSLNTPAGEPLGTVNAPRTVHAGVEAGLDVSLLPALQWRLSALLNRFRFDGHATYGNHALPGIPGQLYRTELAWRFAPHYNVTLSAECSPRRYAIDMANSGFAGAHAVWGLKLAHTRDRGVSWFVEGRNLANRRYAATTGVMADAGGADVAQFLPADGRAVYAGVEWRVN